MTCIIGLVQDGKVYIGGDSAFTSSDDTRIGQARKVFRIGEFLIGCSYSTRAMQIVQYHLKPPAQNDTPDFEYMVTGFVPALRQVLQESGQVGKDEDGCDSGGIILLAGYKGLIYEIHTDFQVGLHVDGFEAIGSGKFYALGAMKALGKLPPQKRIEKALEISAYFCNSVKAPFYIEVL